MIVFEVKIMLLYVRRQSGPLGDFSKTRKWPSCYDWSDVHPVVFELKYMYDVNREPSAIFRKHGNAMTELLQLIRRTSRIRYMDSCYSRLTFCEI